MHDILHKLKERVTQGKGFLKNLAVSLYDFNLASSGAPLTTTLSTNPGFDKADTNLTILSWAASKVVAAGLVIQVPDDYDSAKDHLKLKLKAAMGGATDVPTITAAAYSDSAGTTDLAPDATAALSATKAWVEIDLSSNSLSAGATITLALTPAAHTTDAINVYAAKVEYRSTLVYADRSSTR